MGRFVLIVMALLTFFYLGFFMKVYVLGDLVTYTQLSPLNLGPLCLVYLYELIKEFCG